MGCIATGQTRTGAANPQCPIFSPSRTCANSPVRATMARIARRFTPCVPEFREIRSERGYTLSHVTFLNRQALHLRPDPARVVVRPFKPATEPRDLNPTDKTRANHIVERVLALDGDMAGTQLADVLENFEGRHRDLL